jgi:hypothetical protein
MAQGWGKDGANPRAGNRHFPSHFRPTLSRCGRCCRRGRWMSHPHRPRPPRPPTRPTNHPSGDCFDNAVLESFHASLKKDLIHRRSWPTKTEARTAVFDYIEAFYNRRRRHSTLGMVSPVAYEQDTLRDTGNSHAATRLTETNKINYKSQAAAQAA